MERYSLITEFEKLKAQADATFNKSYENPEGYDSAVRARNRLLLAKQVAGNLYDALGSGTTQKKVLDMAAGTGIISQALLDKGFCVTAADINPHMLMFLKGRFHQVGVTTASFNEPLPFATESFDGMTTVWGNRYITNKGLPLFIDQSYRVLKPDGVFVWPIFPLEAPLWKARAGVRQPTSTQSLANQLLDAGFSSVNIDKKPFYNNLRNGELPITSSPQYITARK